MAMDLWGFKDIRDLKKNISDYPETILKEQIAALGDKTGFVLYGKPLYMRVKNMEIEYGAATIFNVIVPALDNYNKTLLIMYSNFEGNYPVAISVGKSFAEDMEDFCPQYKCDNLDEFKNTLKDILCSDEVMEVIRTLYSKANMIGNE
ncbi:MAG: hypothetical protein MR357_07270 [Anaeroplasma sp.]|nr:hypothetical protein [Anaeroplasma sp.]